MKIPKRCPIASFSFPEGFEPKEEGCKVVFDVDKKDCQCCFPAYMLKFDKTSFCSCPEMRTDAPSYMECNVFSEWFWKGRRINSNGNRNPLDSRLRHEVFKRDGYKCKECGATKEEKTLHCDHIIPVSQGGTDEMDNLQTLCSDCNLAKSDKIFSNELKKEEKKDGTGQR